MTHDHHHPDQEPWHDLPEGFVERLELESRLNEPLRQEALERAARALDAPPSTIIDIGSGAGADAVALAQRFPAAQVHALDVSAELLERVASVAAASGLTDQIVAHQVDLDEEWSKETPREADLAWAALSLHHLSDPAMALRRILNALRPGGVFVLTEQTSQGTFTPPDLGSGRIALQGCMTHEPPADGSRGGPDWSELLERAGFTTVEHHVREFTAQAATADGAQYLQTELASLRGRLSSGPSTEELAGIDAAINAVEAGESEISFSAGRGVWIAVRPQPASSPDVVVVGGGVAGLAAAIALARSRRRVAVIDAGEPRNAPATGAHNVLGQEGVSPIELLARGRAEAESFGVQIIPGHATSAAGEIDDFTVEVDDGESRVHARRIILATGLVDDLPDIPGIEAGWGRTVLHCPFCHGWEVRDQRIAILTRDEVAIHQVMLFGRLSDRLTVFLHEAPDPSEEQWEQLSALGVEVVRARVERLVMDGAAVRGVEVVGGRIFDVDAVVVAPRFNSRTELYESLGGVAQSTPLGRQIPTTPNGLTEVPGVWAAGNAGQPMAMVAASSASGVTTGTAVHGELSFGELEESVEARRADPTRRRSLRRHAASPVEVD